MKRIAIFLVCLVGSYLWMGAGCSSDPNVEGAKLDLRNKDYDRALENLAEALGRNPDNAEAYELKGRVLQQQASETTDSEQYQEAIQEMIEAYDRALTIRPRSRGRYCPEPDDGLRRHLYEGRPGIQSGVGRFRGVSYGRDLFRAGVRRAA